MKRKGGLIFMASIKGSNPRRHINNPADLAHCSDHLDKIAFSSVFAGRRFLEAVEAAGNRLEKNREFNAQHGPVRVIQHDPIPVHRVTGRTPRKTREVEPCESEQSRARLAAFFERRRALDKVG